jgi:ApaG protein
MKGLCRKKFFTPSGRRFISRSLIEFSDLISTSSLGKKLDARPYHTTLDLEKDARIRLTSLRLYRILQRTCTEFERKIPDIDRILLQPLLEAPDWGRHITYTSSSPAQVEDLFRLFYLWIDAEDVREAGADSSDHDSGDGKMTTPAARTKISSAPKASDDSSAIYNPSPIDYWFYELVGKSEDLHAVHDDDDDDDDDEDDSAKLLPKRKFMSCWTSQKQIQEAVRTAFRTLRYKKFPSDEQQPSLLSSTDLHKWAIKAIQSLRVQQTLWTHSSVATTDEVVQIVATSRCIGRTAPVPITMPPSIITPRILADSSPKYRFAYRIRVENISDDQTVVLLGRYWHISEEQDDSIHDVETNPPIVIDSPKTGVVGQHPVLHPGQVFEYMSGTDLATPRGTMTGHLYMARAPAAGKLAQSAEGTQPHWKEAKNKKETTSATRGEKESHETLFFDAIVAPFRLESE